MLSCRAALRRFSGPPRSSFGRVPCCRPRDDGPSSCVTCGHARGTSLAGGVQGLERRLGCRSPWDCSAEIIGCVERLRRKRRILGVRCPQMNRTQGRG
jgi:Zn ribbon nucleic-acid-binding protein